MKATFRNATTLCPFNPPKKIRASEELDSPDDIFKKFSHTENNCIDVTRG